MAMIYRPQDQHTDGRLTQREVARNRGSKTYEGSACKRCGSRIKYTSSAGCVNCRLSRDRTAENTRDYLNYGVSVDTAEQNREESRRNRRRRYRGRPCKHGHTVRLVSNGACVECNLGRPPSAALPIQTRPEPEAGRFRGVFFKDRKQARKAGDRMYMKVDGGCRYNMTTGSGPHGLRFTDTDGCVECRMETEYGPEQLEFAALEPEIWAEERINRLRRYIDKNHTRVEMFDRRHHLQLDGSHTHNPERAGVRGLRIREA